MKPSNSHLAGPVDRPLSVVVGIASLLVGAPILGFGLLAAYKVWDAEPFTIGFILAMVVIGWFCVAAAIRLILGKERSDGGLLSPFALRTGGILFVAMPITIFVLSDRSTWKSVWFAIEIGSFLALAAICFALASRRQNPVLGQRESQDDA